MDYQLKTVSCVAPNQWLHSIQPGLIKLSIPVGFKPSQVCFLLELCAGNIWSTN